VNEESNRIPATLHIAMGFRLGPCQTDNSYPAPKNSVT
jgi:hypothetical protein